MCEKPLFGIKSTEHGKKSEATAAGTTAVAGAAAASASGATTAIAIKKIIDNSFGTQEVSAFQLSK